MTSDFPKHWLDDFNLLLYENLWLTVEPCWQMIRYWYGFRTMAPPPNHYCTAPNDVTSAGIWDIVALFSYSVRRWRPVNHLYSKQTKWRFVYRLGARFQWWISSLEAVKDNHKERLGMLWRTRLHCNTNNNTTSEIMALNSNSSTSSYPNIFSLTKGCLVDQWSQLPIYICHHHLSDQLKSPPQGSCWALERRTHSVFNNVNWKGKSTCVPKTGKDFWIRLAVKQGS